MDTNRIINNNHQYYFLCSGLVLAAAAISLIFASQDLDNVLTRKAILATGVSTALMSVALLGVSWWLKARHKENQTAQYVNAEFTKGVDARVSQALPVLGRYLEYDLAHGDCEIICQDGTLRADYRALRSSPFFEAAFNSHFQEGQEKRIDLTKFAWGESSVVKAYIRYLYLGEVSRDLSELFWLHTIGEQFADENLMNVCKKSLLKILDERPIVDGQPDLKDSSHKILALFIAFREWKKKGLDPHGILEEFFLSQFIERCERFTPSDIPRKVRRQFETLLARLVNDERHLGYYCAACAAFLYRHFSVNTPGEKEWVGYAITSANEGNPYGQYLYGNYLLQQDDEDSKALGLAYLLKSAEQDNVCAEMALAYHYKKQNNQAKMRECLETAVVKGYPEAFSLIGTFHLDGNFGYLQDHEKAFEYFSRGAAMGEKWCIANLGYCFQRGSYVQVNREKAIAHYNKAWQFRLDYAKKRLEELGERPT